MTIHIGTMGWSYGFWRGNFYPKALSSKNFLEYYSRKFNTVEVNNTFYRIPSKQTVEEWKSQTPEGFLFSLKFPQIITHIKMLKNCSKEVEVFLNHISSLKEKLGILLLQFSHNFGLNKIALLYDFLKSLPKNYRIAVEVRNPKLLNEKLYSILRETGTALVWVDSPSMPEIREVTSKFVYIRWEGNREQVKGTLGKNEASITPKIKTWIERIKPLLKQKTEVYGYFSKHFSGHPPSDVRTMIKMIDQ